MLIQLTMKSLRASQAIFDAFPGAVLGVVVFRNIDNHGESAAVMAELRNEQSQTIQRFANTSINDHPHIATWREAYRKFGAKPKDYPSSIENLVKRIVKGYQLPHINLLVDIYNTLSLRYTLPVGAEDIDRIEGDVELDFASDGEPAVRLLGEKEERPPRAGEVIYKDAVGAICRRWNWKEADRTKITPETANGFVVSEILPPVQRSVLETAMDELARLIHTHCGGTLSTAMIDAANPKIQLI